MRKFRAQKSRAFLSFSLAVFFLFMGVTDTHACGTWDIKCKGKAVASGTKKTVTKGTTAVKEGVQNTAERVSDAAQRVAPDVKEIAKEAKDVGEAVQRAGGQLVKDPRKFDFKDIGEEMGEFVVELGEEAIKAAVAPVVLAKAQFLAGWIRLTRDNLLREGVQPIPSKIREMIRKIVPDYPERLLNKTRYRVGTGGALSVSGITQTFGDAQATTLDYVIVFKPTTCGKTQGGQYIINYPVDKTALWAHELYHVLQYDRWGIYNFSIEYLRNWSGVENKANNYEEQYIRTAKQRGMKEGDLYLGASPPCKIIIPRGLPSDSTQVQTTPTDEDILAMEAAWIEAENSEREDRLAVASEDAEITSRGVGMPASSAVLDNAIVLERQLYFLTPTGQLFPLHPGNYLVGLGTSRRIRLYTQNNRVNIHLNTMVGMHEESVPSPIVGLVPDDDNPDFQAIVLVLPNKNVLVATGSISGKRPKGEVLIR